MAKGVKFHKEIIDKLRRNIDELYFLSPTSCYISNCTLIVELFINYLNHLICIRSGIP